MINRLCAFAVLACLSFAATAEIPLTDFTKHSLFSTVRISPDGRYFAATAPVKGKDNLVVIERATMKPTMNLGMRAFEEVGEFTWVTNERLIFRTQRKFGSLDRPLPTGDLYAVDYNGHNQVQLLGCAENSVCIEFGIDIVDILRDEPGSIIATQFKGGGKANASKINIRSGKAINVGSTPSRWGSFTTDNTGRIRLSHGTDTDGNEVIHYRDASGGDWQLLDTFDRKTGGLRPVMFTRDNSKIYVYSDREGEGGINLYDPATKELTHLAGHDVVDIDHLVYDEDEYPIAAVFQDGPLTTDIFESESKGGKILKILENSFPGQHVHITSWTWDGKECIFLVISDTNPGDYYLFNTETKQAQYLLSRRPWTKPEQIAKREPIEIMARDGLKLYGYLIAPLNKPKENLPTIILPHGGPHGPRDEWVYDFEAALFADRGYAVLQVNFRGSGGYGKDFETMGYRKWGREMQDDLTDATLWAVEQGIADPERICIYGASYGGYATLMGVVREPDLYKCAIGYVGVYDLELMHKRGDIQQVEEGRAILVRYIGKDEEELKAWSPVNHVDKIKTPLFIVHGKRDIRAHYANYEALTAALKKQGIKFDSLVKRDEAHGFYDEKNREELYIKMLAFFDKYIGSKRTGNNY